MRVEYSKRATNDLRRVSEESRAFGEMVAAAVEERIREIVAHIAEHPEAAARVMERPGMYVIPLISLSIQNFLSSLRRQDQDTAHSSCVASAVDEEPVNCPEGGHFWDTLNRWRGNRGGRLVVRPSCVLLPSGCSRVPARNPALQWWSPENEQDKRVWLRLLKECGSLGRHSPC